MTTGNSSARSSGSRTSLQEVKLIREQGGRDVYEKYDIVTSMGQGSMGAVSMVRIRPEKVGGSAFEAERRIVFGLSKFRTKKKTGDTLPAHLAKNDHVYALKSIILDRVKNEVFVRELHNEIDILKSLDHPNIVRLHEVYRLRKNIFLVLELCQGGDLFTRSPYSEREASRICGQVMSAVCYLHEHGVVHRDLKFENIMFEDKSDSADTKIIDFGLSKKFSGAPKYMSERVGTIYTMAPEVVRKGGIYSSQVDLWSMGVITYMLLCTTKPFYERDREKMIAKIQKAKYKTDGFPTWDKLSDHAKDFVKKLIVVDARKRMTASQALQHPWLQCIEQLPNDKPSEQLLATIDNALTSYVTVPALKKLALKVIAHYSTAPDVMELRKAFEQFDSARNGVLSYDELKTALSQCPSFSKDEAHLQTVFDSLDTNQDGLINYTEFLAATIEAHEEISEDRIAEAFDRIDCDNSGYISKANLRSVLGNSCTTKEINAMISSGDTNNDGRISYREFLQIFRKSRIEEDMAALSIASS